MAETQERAFHLVGIGGAGMSAIAELLAAEGASVSGSDRLESPVLERLRGLGIDAYSPHNAQRVPAEATVVLSSAIRETNPEWQIAKSRGQEVIHRSEALAIAASGKRFVAVAGAHGKTTTSSMITQALATCGKEPSSAIGGTILGFDTGAILGGGDVFVAEADESDGSFLNYRPQVAVVTNVEADHLDHFGSAEAFEDAFLDFGGRITPGGTLICCGEDAGSARLSERAAIAYPKIRVWTYGRPDRCERQPDIQLDDFRVDSVHAEASVRAPGTEWMQLQLKVTGEHNLLNAGGAWAAGCALDMDPQQFAGALGSFIGAGRRFEFHGEVAGRRLYEDYAHHPTEIQAALIQARTVAEPGRLVVVFQPHLYSRTANFADRFARALSLADEVVLADIYAAREDPIEGVTSALLAQRLRLLGREAYECPGASVAEAAEMGAALTGEGDLLVLVGAGDIELGIPGALAYWEKL